MTQMNRGNIYKLALSLYFDTSSSTLSHTMFLNRATMPMVATLPTLPAPYIVISALPTLPTLPVALPTLPGETFSEKTYI